MHIDLERRRDSAIAPCAFIGPSNVRHPDVVECIFNNRPKVWVFSSCFISGVSMLVSQVLDKSANW